MSCYLLVSLVPCTTKLDIGEIYGGPDGENTKSAPVQVLEELGRNSRDTAADGQVERLGCSEEYA